MESLNFGRFDNPVAIVDFKNVGNNGGKNCLDRGNSKKSAADGGPRGYLFHFADDRIG